MSTERLFNPPVITEEIQHLLGQLDDYDDPCLFLFHSNAEESERANILASALESEQQLDAPVYHLSNGVTFSLAFSDVVTTQVIADEVIEDISNNNYQGNLSVFRHNCLGQPLETFDWAMQQLTALIIKGHDEAQLAINDFKDRANWPGIEQYRGSQQDDQCEHCGDDSKTKPGLVSRLFSGVAGLFRSRDVAEQAELEQFLSVLFVEPFISNLPNGKKLWRYVLTGEGKQELEQMDAFIDLDHVLFVLHAKQHAPEFYRDVLEVVSYDSLPEQNDIYEYLYRVLTPLVDDLEETESKQELKRKQECFLRLLDVFYHLFDQQPLSEEIYDILVEDEDTACLDELDYQQRYGQEEKTEAGQLPALVKQHIIELTDRLEDYHFASYRDFSKLNKIFAGNRLTYDPLQWQSTEPRSNLLLASILLYKDHEQSINDEHTLALKKLINEDLFEQVIQEISSELEPSKTLPESFVNWLQSEEIGDVAEQSKALKEILSGDIGMDASRTFKTAQPHYQLYSNISDFQPLLAACYWLQLCQPSMFTNKVIQVSLNIAPQATLSCFAHLYLKRRGAFGEQEHRQKLLDSFKQLGVDKHDVLSFEAHQSKGGDVTRYEELIRHYAKSSEQDKLLWQQALAKLTPKTRDNFYLNVFRLEPDAQTPLLTERPMMLKELIRKTIFFDDDFFANQFDKELVLFNDHCEYFPEEYELPVEVHEQVKPNDPDANFIALRHMGEHVELIIDNAEQAFDPEKSSWPYSSHYIVFHQSTDLNAVFKILEGYENYKVRSEKLLAGILSYLAGDISFAQYQQEFGHYSNVKDYDLSIQYYSAYSPKILPQILAEPDEQKQLRLIKLLCSHKSRGKRVLTDISEQLFLDDCLKQGFTDFAMRQDLEVEELTDDWVERWKAFHKVIEQKVAAIN